MALEHRDDERHLVGRHAIQAEARAAVLRIDVDLREVGILARRPAVDQDGAVAGLDDVAIRAERRSGERDGFDLVFCDMVAHVIPLLRRRRDLRIIFYCHFPDLLQTPPRRGWYGWYRVPFDRWEARALDSADRVLVNSAYTAGVYRATFPHAHHAPEVLHPAIDVDAHASSIGARPSTCETIVAVSRFDPGKNLGLALERDYSQFNTRHARIGERWVAFEVSEGDQGQSDLNGDGDSDDGLLYVHDLATGAIHADTPPLAACRRSEAASASPRRASTMKPR